MKQLLVWLVVTLTVALLVGVFVVLPPVLSAKLNATLKPSPYQVSDPVRSVHERLMIADLHADTLLWDRNLLDRGTRGHVDVPRLIEGNVALQVFTIVTKTPRDQNIDHNRADTDNIALLAIAEHWPPWTWNSLLQRALFQSLQLRKAARDSDGKLALIRTRTELASFLAKRKIEQRMTAAVLGVEGAHALEGKLEHVDELFDAGVRMMAPVHFFDNDIGGSAHGLGKTGLTDKGKDLIRLMERKGMVVDLAHASAQTIDDTLAIATRPVLVSHTGVKGTCDNNRNLSDAQLRAIAGRGGLIGIGFWETAVCGKDAKAIARAIRYTANLVGVQHVALGSDYDGAVAVPFDVSGMALLTEALLADGFSEPDIALIMGGNTLALLSELLPR